MWQLYALGGLLTAAGENVIDKAAIVHDVSLDFFVASFWRPFMYLVAVLVIGFTGILGSFHFAPYWSIVAIAPIGIFSSLFYTHLLRKIELTSINAAAYLVPIAFLFIDTYIVRTHLTMLEILGIFLLVAGGIGFALDGTTLRFKGELDWRIWSIFLFNIAWGGIETYLFKHLNTVYGINGISFFGTLWIYCSVLLFLVALGAGKYRELFRRKSFVYVSQTSFSKLCDALNSIFWT